MAMQHVRRLAIAALVLGSGVEAARVDADNLEALEPAAPDEGEEVVVEKADEDEVDATRQDDVPESPTEVKEDGWGTKFGNGLKAFGTALTRRTECCCSTEEPLLHYICVPKDVADAKTTSTDLYSVMFKSVLPFASLEAKSTKEKRSVIPVERDFKNKNRAEAEGQTLITQEIESLHFSSLKAHKCVDGKKAKANKKATQEAEEVVIDTYKMLVDDGGIEQTRGNFYRYQLAGQELQWDKDFVSLGGAIYKQKRDEPKWMCLDEQSDVTITWQPKQGAECQEVSNCKKIMQTPQCGPDGDYALYELHGRSDGKCQRLWRGQWCPEGGFENSILKPVYGDTHGMYKLCLCDGSKKC